MNSIALSRSRISILAEQPRNLSTAEFTDGGVDTGKKLLDLTQSKDRNGHWTYRHYNGNRQMDWIKDPLSHKTAYEYCTCGALTSITDPNGNVTEFGRDLQSRVTFKKFHADNSTILYGYEDASSRLKSTTDAMSQITKYHYGIDDNVSSISYVDVRNYTPWVSFEYDDAYDRLTTMVDGTGQTDYRYYGVDAAPQPGDYANALKEVDGPLSNDTIKYSYDELGRATGQTINGTAAAATNFDSLGRVKNTINPLGTFPREYESDVTPRVTKLTSPDHSRGHSELYVFHQR